ncbi:MAG: OmpA family protein [Myxococcales bacterium]|nr:OmpA family protein [Myxococcales bacterium]
MRVLWVLGLATMLAAVVPGCTTDPYTGERQVSKTAIGAGIGALAGAGIGVLIGDHGSERGRNAMIGAGIGALAGGAVGVYMDRQEAELRRRLESSGVSVTRVGDQIVLNMPGNVTFDVDSDAIRASFYEVLNSVAIVLEEYEKTLVHVTGHTDSTGSLEHNQLLSQRRAESVSSYLAAQGVVAARLMARGYGPTRPIATNSTTEGRQQNRRVEITLQPFTE